MGNYETKGRKLRDNGGDANLDQQLLAGEMNNRVRQQVLRRTLEHLGKAGKLELYAKVASSNVSTWAKRSGKRNEITPKVEVCRGDWGDVVQKMTKKYGVVYAALNMANAYMPGGGYVEGMVAQEENMFRRTSCHFFIDRKELQPNELYPQHMTDLINGEHHRVYLDTQRPRVCIRGSEATRYRWFETDEIFPFFELRSAADDLRGLGSHAFNESSSRRKIEAQFETLKQHGVRHVVLSAFGCGAFGNPPDRIAAIYKEAIAKYNQDLDHVVFAVYHAGYGTDNFPAFQSVLAQAGEAKTVDTPSCSFGCIPSAEETETNKQTKKMEPTTQKAGCFLPHLDAKTWSTLVTLLESKVATEHELLELLHKVHVATGHRDPCQQVKVGKHVQVGQIMQFEGEKLQDQYKGLVTCLGTMDKARRKGFFSKTLPFMQELALSFPILFSSGLPLLSPGTTGSVTLSARQAACLLSGFFFDLYSKQEHLGQRILLSFRGWLARALKTHQFKLQCVIRYFEVMRHQQKDSPKKLTKHFFFKNKTPREEKKAFSPKDRAITIHRRALTEQEITLCSQDSLLSCEIPLTEFVVDRSREGIECASGSLQMNFANKDIGGLVLATGCVQEEIRFSINPECLVAMLLCPTMQAHESITVIGAERVASYKGYGGSTSYGGDFDDLTPFDSLGRRATAIVGIDALQSPLSGLGSFRRDLVKCLSGFCLSEPGLDATAYPGVATGNWGCGMFGGDPQTKAVIQWVGATLAGRRVVYFPFADKRVNNLELFVTLLASSNISTVSKLWHLLSSWLKREACYEVESFFDFSQRVLTEVPSGLDQTDLESSPT
mmetsp:Transcript_13649/g.26470  ORF Transcript_13649/g.26470 Transcript_13649/m.26470 type:complete len:833 (+) Transcript_13649:27-2525(+)